MLYVEQAQSVLTGEQEAATVMPQMVSEIDGWVCEGIADCDIEMMFAGDGEDDLDEQTAYSQGRQIVRRLKNERERGLTPLTWEDVKYRKEVAFAKALGLFE